MSNETQLDWTFDIDVPTDSALHDVVRETLARRPADRRPVHRAVLGALGWMLGRPVPLVGSLHGDHVGLAEVSVALSAGARRTLRLIAVAVPSKWRWRSEGDALVGRAPRPCDPQRPELDVPDRRVACAFTFRGDAVGLDRLSEPVVGLRRGELHLHDVGRAHAAVRWQLRFDAAAQAEQARPRVEEFLARIRAEHGEHGLRYEGDWSIEGAMVSGTYRADAAPDWPTVLTSMFGGSPSQRVPSDASPPP